MSFVGGTRAAMRAGERLAGLAAGTRSFRVVRLTTDQMLPMPTTHETLSPIQP